MVIEDVGPRDGGCYAVVFPYVREIKAKFVVWGIYSGAWKAFREAPNFATSGF